MYLPSLQIEVGTCQRVASTLVLLYIHVCENGKMVSLLVDAHYRIVMSAIYRYRYIYTHTAHSGVVFTPLCVIRRKAFKGPNDFCGHFPFLHCFIRGVYIRNGTESRELHAGCFSLQFLSHTLISIIINIRGQIDNRPLQNTRSAGRKRLTAGC